MIPFVDLKAQYARLKPAFDTRIRTVLEHGHYIDGPEIGELEEALARFAGCTDAVAVSSGTDALLIALMAERIGPGDAVFLPAFTFPATAEAILLLQATPVFVDVQRHTFNIDPVDLERRVEEVASGSTLRPRAVIAVDLFGLPADYPAISLIAEHHDLFVLSDAAQSRTAGALAPGTATSFFPAKPLGCYGDGGAVLTDDRERAKVMRSIRAHGKDADKYDIIRLGLNGRLDTIQAAVLLAKLDIFADELAARARVARLYDDGLEGVVITPARPPGADSAWAQYTIRTPRREQLRDALRAEGFPTAVYYPRPLHLQPAYAAAGPGPGSMPVSEELSAQVLSLPMHPYLEPEVVSRICRVIGDTLLGSEAPSAEVAIAN